MTVHIALLKHVGMRSRKAASDLSMKQRAACQIRSSYDRQGYPATAAKINRDRSAGFISANLCRHCDVVMYRSGSGLLVSSFTAANAQLVKRTWSAIVFVLEDLAPAVLST